MDHIKARAPQNSEFHSHEHPTSHGGRVPYLPRHHTPEELIHERKKYTETDFKDLIRKLNLKVTQQRLLILQCLVRSGKHVTAQELFDMVSKEDHGVGFATVYRFLKSLTDNRYATEVRVGNMPSRYELTPPTHHDHLTCTKCGMICEFENEAIEKLQKKVADHFGFILEHHVLELYGICPKCQTSDSLNPSS